MKTIIKQSLAWSHGWLKTGLKQSLMWLYNRQLITGSAVLRLFARYELWNF